jgi:hypothetical protein
MRLTPGILARPGTRLSSTSLFLVAGAQLLPGGKESFGRPANKRVVVRFIAPLLSGPFDVQQRPERPG